MSTILLRVDDLDGEIWKPVVGHEGAYEVSNMGRVRSLDRTVPLPQSRRHPQGKLKFLPGRLLRPGRCKSGYLSVSIKGRTHLVQHLVAAAFIGPRPPGLLVLHRDDVKDHNREPNLRYGTHQDNHDDMLLSGSRVMGESFRSARLNNTAAAAIRALKGRVSQSALASAFGVSPAAVQAVHDGRTWTHVAPMPTEHAAEIIRERRA